MARCRVVQPETIPIPMSDGDRVEVKKELNAGEYHALINDMVERKPFSKLVAYLVGWSFVGLDGKLLPYSLELTADHRRDTIRSLDKATMRELIAVIDRHEAAEEAALEAKKKTRAGEPASSPISALRSDADGSTTPSTDSIEMSMTSSLTN